MREGAVAHLGVARHQQTAAGLEPGTGCEGVGGVPRETGGVIRSGEGLRVGAVAQLGVASDHRTAAEWGRRRTEVLCGLVRTARVNVQGVGELPCVGIVHQLQAAGTATTSSKLWCGA